MAAWIGRQRDCWWRRALGLLLDGIRGAPNRVRIDAIGMEFQHSNTQHDAIRVLKARRPFPYLFPCSYFDVVIASSEISLYLAPVASAPNSGSDSVQTSNVSITNPFTFFLCSKRNELT